MLAVSAETSEPLRLGRPTFDKNEIIGIRQCINDHRQPIGTAHGLTHIRIALRDDIRGRIAVRVDAVGEGGISGQKIGDAGEIRQGGHPLARAGRARHVDQDDAPPATGDFSCQCHGSSRAIIAGWGDRKGSARALLQQVVGNGGSRKLILHVLALRFFRLMRFHVRPGRVKVAGYGEIEQARGLFREEWTAP